MPQKKQWTEREDQVLKYLFDVEKMTKWSKIAQKMSEEFKFPVRNGKQCRERYQSSLDPSFQHHEWTQAQQERMYELHNEIGNKWAQIAQKMPGRTDNCVKNHMYSKLRKAIRKLNKTINKEFKKEIKEIRQTVLYKIIQATDQNFKGEGKRDEQIAKMSSDLKNALLHFSTDDEVQDVHLPKVLQLARDVQEFSKVYKRKPKKERRGHAQVKNLMKMPKIQKYKCASDIESDSDDYQIAVDNQESIELGSKNVKEEPLEQPQYIAKIKPVIEVSSLRMRKDDLYQSQRRQMLNDSFYGVEKALKDAGILQDGNMHFPYLKLSVSESNVSERNQQFNLAQSIDRGVNRLGFSTVLKNDLDMGEDKLFNSMNQ